MEEAFRISSRESHLVRSIRARFILTAHGTLYHIYESYIELTYGTETWAMKAVNRHSLERTERMMVRWMYEVSLKERNCSLGYSECG